jgi:hypothetical protein
MRILTGLFPAALALASPVAAQTPPAVPAPRPDRITAAIQQRLGAAAIEDASKADQIAQLTEQVAALQKRLNEIPGCIPTAK